MDNFNMSEKKGNFYKIVSVVANVIFTLLILAPIAMFFIFGEDDAFMEGEKEYEAPSFDVDGFITAEFQNKFELWFSTKYPMRSTLVNFYRQMEYDTAVIGKFDISTAFIRIPAPVETIDNNDLVGGDVYGEGEVMKKNLYADFNPLYADLNRRLYERKANEPVGYKGNDAVVIGKGGYCFERAYINELYGYSEPYNTVTDEFLEGRVEMLEYIQKRLGDMGIACYLVISPSKAAQYERFIPEWYKAQNIAAEGYIRPVKRVLPMLDAHGINYTYTPDLYKEIGLEETFPLTGIHWNKLAAIEALRVVLEKYTEMTGVEVRHIEVKKVVEQENPSGFGNPEDDIYNIAYSGVDKSNSVTDEKYYVPLAEVVNPECSNRLKVLVSGGSFTWDFKHYLRSSDFRITKFYDQFYYDKWQGGEDTDPIYAVSSGLSRRRWSEILDDVDYFVFECNEQFVATMGNAVYDSLYEFLLKTDDSAD